MSVTVADILDSIAMRRGESGTPDNTTENKRRISFINQAYMALLTKRKYWFTEKTVKTALTVADQEEYTLPTDFREMIEVRVDDYVREPEPHWVAFSEYEYPPIDQVYTGYYSTKYYFIFEGKLHLLPIPSTSASSANIQYRYYCWPTKLTASIDTVLIPEPYCELLAAYACARLAKIGGKRGTASDDFDEFNEIVKEMNKENLNRATAATGGW